MQVQSWRSDPELLHLHSWGFSTWPQPPSQIRMDGTLCKPMLVKGSEAVGKNARNPGLPQLMLQKLQRVPPKSWLLVFKEG